MRLNVTWFVFVAVLIFTLLLPPVQPGILICHDNNVRYGREVRHVMRVAREAVEARGRNRYWIDSIERGRDPKSNEEHWRVHMQRFPIVSGGHATAYVSDEDRLAGYYGGK